MTMTLELSEKLEQRLRDIAQERRISPEEVAVDLLDELLQSQPKAQPQGMSVEEAGEYVQRKNAELYRRLA